MHLLLVLLAINLFTFVALNIYDALPGLVNQFLLGWIRLGFYSTFFYFLLGVASVVLFSRFSAGAQPVELLKQITIIEWVLRGIYLISVMALPMPMGIGSNSQAFGVVLLSLFCGFLIQKIRVIVPFFTTLGKYSYFLYFMQILVIYWLSSVLMSLDKSSVPLLNVSLMVFLAYVAIILSISLPLAWFSARFFEGPFLRLARSKPKSPSNL
jgi:peptidoglycan/LPS O-acetylase OafA/YrhL